ncbi:MAG: LamG domain-containing protein [Pirellulales bacterium]|nr:LamG domain-containing protein [Pirellulales bacterium]
MQGILEATVAAGLWLLASLGLAETAADHRPPLDKKPYLKTVWSHANPWWPPNKSRTHGEGGPDFAWHVYSDDAVTMWKQVAERCGAYGLTGLQMEVVADNAGYVEVCKDVAEGFRQSGKAMFLQPFIRGHATSVDEATRHYRNTFDRLAPELHEHPNFYRLGNSPVVVIYDPSTLKPAEWGQLMEAVEKKHGRIVWLANAAQASAEWVREYLPYFDGISMYANWSEEMQAGVYGALTEVLHREFPQKIFEGAVHTTYLVHFHYGGVVPSLTQKYRNSWDIALKAAPDSLTITNWFDTYENSHIMPSYEREDILLRIAQQRLAHWRSQEPARTAAPDLYVANTTNVLLGQPLEFEVLGFPVDGGEKGVRVTLELCDERENVLHAFPAREMLLDELRVARFELPSQELAAQRAIRPRLTWAWGQQPPATSHLLPPTHLAASLRPHLLFWCRSMKRMIQTADRKDWLLGGAHAGGTARFAGDGVTPLVSFAYSDRSSADEVDRGGGWVRVLRNGRELESFANWNLKFATLLRLPDPGAALDWYQLELENANGGKYLSPAIWVSAEKRPGMVKLPILLPDDSVGEVSIEAARVPFFQYDCRRQTAPLLYDSSGYEHHGYLGGKGYGGGHLARTGYRHEHTGCVAPAASDDVPTWKADGESGFLKFSGRDYVMIQGGTAFPYASTYELFVRPEAVGSRQAILGAAGGQVSIAMNEDGKVEATRLTPAADATGKITGHKALTLTSRDTLEPGRWTHIAVVYDLRDLHLYVGRKLQAEAACPPWRSHEMINAVVVGGLCRFPYDAVPQFVGDLTKIRFYGRDLRADEFLDEQGVPKGT